MTHQHQRFVLPVLLFVLCLTGHLEVAEGAETPDSLSPLQRSLVREHSSLKRTITGQERPNKPKTKLHQNLTPLEYNLKLELQADKFHSNINGAVEIYVDFHQGDRGSFLKKQWQHMTRVVSCKGVYCDRSSLNTITLNVGDGVIIREARVEFGGSLDSLKRNKGEQVVIENKILDEESQILALVMSKPLATASFGKITIKYSSIHYFESVRYADRSKPLRSYLNFRFPPRSVDRTFPCFNDPRHRVKITLSVFADKRLQVHSNMPATGRTDVAGNRQQTTFDQTPPMPIHKLVFSVGQYDEPISLPKTSLAPMVRVVTSNGEPKSGQFALELTQKGLEWMARQTGQRLPIKQFQIIATHLHEVNTTESFGCALINLERVLIDSVDSSPEAQILAAFNVAYVVARQWFGGLISARRWRDGWITDGLAAQMAVGMLRELKPELGVEHYLRSHLLTQALRLRAVRALRGGAQEDSDGALDFIKDAAIMSTARSLIGRDRFQSAVRSLFENNSDRLVDQDTFVAAISRATDGQQTETELRQFLEAWRRHSSFPTLSVQLDQSDITGTIQIYQNPVHKLKRIDVVGLWPNQRGVQVPLKVLFSNKDGSQQEVVVMKDAFKEDPISTGPKWNAQAVPMPSWFNLRDYNSGHWLKILAEPDELSFYRVRYMPSGNLFGRLESPIRTKSMGAEDRSSLLDDASGLVPINTKFVQATGVDQLINWVGDEQDSRVVNSQLLAKRNYAEVFEIINEEKTLPPPASLGHPLPSCKQTFDKFGFAPKKAHESVFEQFVRGAALIDLIESNHQPAIKAALSAFEQVSSAAAFLRSPIYLAVVRWGSAAQLRRLFERLKSARWPEEIDRIRENLEKSGREDVRDQARNYCKTHACM